MKNTTFVGLAAAALLVVALGGYAVAHYEGIGQGYARTGTGFASGGYGGGCGGVCDADHHQAVEEALEAGDYTAWIAAMAEGPGRHRITDYVTEENFAAFARMHEAMDEGDLEEAAALRSQLGLGAKSGECLGGCGGQGYATGARGRGPGMGYGAVGGGCHR